MLAQPHIWGFDPQGLSANDDLISCHNLALCLENLLRYALSLLTLLLEELVNYEALEAYTTVDALLVSIPPSNIVSSVATAILSRSNPLTVEA